VYALMNLGGFGMILLLSRAGFEADQLDDWQGLEPAEPWLRVHDAAADVLDGRHSADRRLLREVGGARRRWSNIGYCVAGGVRRC
jgi:hypothetical protein